MWARSWAFSSSYWVRRVMTSCRHSMWCCKPLLSVSTRGSLPFTSASIFTPKVDCMAVYLKSWLSTFLGWASRFSSITRRMPLRSDSSRTQACAGQPVVVDQLGDLLVQGGLVHLVGQLGDDDAVAARLALFDVGLGAHDHAAPAGGVGVADALVAHDDAAGGEIGAGHELHQLFDRGVGVIYQEGDGVGKFAQVVGRDVGRHTDRDARRAVEQQVGQRGRAARQAPAPSRRSWG